MAIFDYTGDCAVTAVGAVSGRSYHFSPRGPRVAVDLRDRASLLGVPGLVHLGYLAP